MLFRSKVRKHIQKSKEEYLAGKSRPAEEFLKELRQEALRKRTQRLKV